MSISEAKAVFLHISHLDTRCQRRLASWPVMWVGMRPSRTDAVLAPANKSSALDRSSIDRHMNRRLKVKPALKRLWLKLSMPEKTQRTSVRSEVYSNLNARASIYYWEAMPGFFFRFEAAQVSVWGCMHLVVFLFLPKLKSKNKITLKKIRIQLLKRFVVLTIKHKIIFGFWKYEWKNNKLWVI